MLQCTAHKEHVDRIAKHLRTNSGLRCTKEKPIDNRRIDLQCGSNNIEVKCTNRDYNSGRSQDQLADMKKYSDSHNQGLVIATPEGCFKPMNRKGQEFIKEHNFPECSSKF